MFDSIDGHVAHARDVIEATKFAAEDPDHVLRRQFQRLHLYNLYSKHDKLVKLDEEIARMEMAVIPGKDGLVEDPASAIRQAGNLNDILLRISLAIQEFSECCYTLHGIRNIDQICRNGIPSLQGEHDRSQIIEAQCRAAKRDKRA